MMDAPKTTFIWKLICHHIKQQSFQQADRHLAPKPADPQECDTAPRLTDIHSIDRYKDAFIIQTRRRLLLNTTDDSDRIVERVPPSMMLPTI